MKKLLELSYEYQYQYPELEKDIEDILNECLLELENGNQKWPTISKYRKQLWELIYHYDNTVEI